MSSTYFGAVLVNVDGGGVGSCKCPEINGIEPEPNLQSADRTLKKFWRGADKCAESRIMDAKVPLCYLSICIY